MSADNPVALVLAPRKCIRIKRNGDPCGNWPRHGQTVCGYHGGSAPQNIRAARQRLNETAWTAVEALRWVIAEAQRTRDLAPLIAACRTVLDRIPGFGSHATVGMQLPVDEDTHDYMAFLTDEHVEQMATWIADAREAAARAKQAAEQYGRSYYDHAIDAELLEAGDEKA